MDAVLGPCDVSMSPSDAMDFMGPLDRGYKYADVTFEVNGELLMAHRLVVAQSPLLARLIDQRTDSEAPVVIPSSDSEFFEVLLDWMYGTKTKIAAIDLFSLFSIAVKYEVHGLERKCCEVMQGRLNDGNCTAIYQLASLMGESAACATLQQAALDYMRSRVASTGSVKVIKHAMTLCEDDAAVQADGCTAIANHCAHFDVATCNESVLLVKRAMFKHIGDITVQSAACGALVALTSVSDDTKKFTSEQDLIPLACNSIEAHMRDPDVVVQGLGFVWNLINYSQANQSIASEHDLVPLVKRAMEWYDENPDVQLACLGVLTSVIGGDAANQQSLLSSGVLNHLQDTLEFHCESPHITRRALGAVLNLTVSPVSRPAVCEAGLIPFIAMPLEQHYTDIGIARLGAAILHNLSGTPDGKSALRRTGCIHLLASILDLHIDDAMLAQEVCGAIRQLCAENNANRKVAVAEDFVVLLGRTLRAHVDFPDVAKESCGALRNICYASLENQNMIRGEGIILRIIRTVEQHTDIGLLVEAVGVLGALAEANPANQAEIRESYGITQIIDVMRQDPNHCELQTACCLAVQNLAGGCPENQEMLRTLEAIQLVIIAMDTHAKSARLQREACGALCYLSGSCPPNKVVIRESNGFLVIKQAMVLHARVPDVIQQASAAIRNLAAKSPENKAAMLELQYFDILRQAMMVHAKGPKVMEQVVGAIRNLIANCLPNQRALKECGVLPQLRQLTGYHPDDAVLQQAVSSILLILSQLDETEPRSPIVREGSGASAGTSASSEVSHQSNTSLPMLGVAFDSAVQDGA